MVIVVAQQKGGGGKTTTAANVTVLFARDGHRVLVIDADPQFALTRQLELEARALGAKLVDVLAGRASAQDAIVADVHGVDAIAGARELAGVEMSLVAEVGREHFLHDALEPVRGDYDHVVIDTPPNLGLLTVNALVCADHVLAPVSAEDDASLHGILELRATMARLSERLGTATAELTALLIRWQPERVSSRRIEKELIDCGLQPLTRVRSRSAAIAHAACNGVPVAVSAPDSTITLAYQRVVEQLTVARVR